MGFSNFKPMLAKDAQLDPEGRVKVNFPVAVQVKLDGIRACVVDGKLVTRTLKEVQNREIFEALSRPEFEGLDGEIIVGDHMAEGCFGRTSSYVMSRDKTGQDWCYYVFDKWDSDATFTSRLGDANGVVYISDERVCSASVSEAKADLIVSTAHKAKGREWNRVRVAADFNQPEDGGMVARAELMLMYVCVTRARQALDNSALAWIDEYMTVGA